MPGDLAGLLCGPAQVVRRDETARISVVLSDGWRISALVEELALRDLPSEVLVAGPADGWSGPAGQARSVRTAFCVELAPLGGAWGASGMGKRPPPSLILDGPALRLWCVVAGRNWEAGYTLGLGEHDSNCWDAIGAALAHAGLPAAFVGPRGAGPAYRLTGARRLGRLAELVGDPPPGAPDDAWPM